MCYVSRMTRFGIEAVAERVRQGIDQSGLRPFARELGVPVGVIRSVASGRDPSASNLQEIASALGMEFYVGPVRDFPVGLEPEVKWIFSQSETLPHIGFAKCGIDGWANVSEVATPLPRPEGLDDPDAFYVTARGQSMLPEGIRDGAICLISPATEAKDGDRIWLRDKQGKQALKRLLRQTEKSLLLLGWQPLHNRKQESFEDERFLTGIDTFHPVVAVFQDTGDGFELIPDPALSQWPGGEPEGDIARIRLHDVQASAGPGQLARDGRILSEVGFPIAWLKRHGISPSKATLIYVDGDSMSPTIESGAMVLVDSNRTTLRRKRVYAFRDGDELFVKRLEKLGDQVLVLSDNPDHDARLIAGADLERFAVLGEVVWTGRDWS